MSTTTGSQNTRARADIATGQAGQAGQAGQSLQGWLLILQVFVAGAASLALELSASRLLAPYFGTSLFVWANLIGLILLYLTLGYFIGGRVADRYPRPGVFYSLIALAAFLISCIPLISRPILHWSLSSFSTYSVGVFYGSLVAVILLFAAPMILLGCVAPFAIRLRVQQVGRSGHTAGMLYALSTAGSILGTFLPAFWLIPTYGTYGTFVLCGVVLFLFALLGLIFSQAESLTMPALVLNRRLLTALLLIPMLLSLSGLQGPIKPPSGTNGGGKMLAERESVYNYIQVVRSGNETQLILNEGVGIHSIYNPDKVLTRGPWDYFSIAPYFNNPPFTENQVRKACIVGLGAGTIPRELSAVYGPLPIDGVELDGEIVNLARQYFHMNEPNLHVVVQDGRYFLQNTPQTYDLIGIDAYQQPYVPFQLTTSEFFRLVRSHLSPTGVAVINAGRTNKDFRLVEALAQTMHTVFPNVYIIDSARFANSMVIGTNAPTQKANFTTNAGRLTNPLLQMVASDSINYGNIREEQGSRVFFTDDHAPVEQLIDAIIFNEVESGKK
ncbi:MAG: fused MFS/spermidine synthase [Ktedonobacteraceae bacterium]